MGSLDLGFGFGDVSERAFEKERESHDGVDGHVSQGHVAVDQMTVDLHRTRIMPSAWNVRMTSTIFDG